MAHIVSCMAEADLDGISHSSYIQKPASPHSSSESVRELPVLPLHPQSCSILTTALPQQLVPSVFDKQPFVWRMHQQQAEARKYQLFPKEKKLPPLSGSKSLDPEQAFAVAMGQTGEKSDKSSSGSGLRLRIKEHNLTRRRKVSVPELGPMTTVQEVPMDSRTCFVYLHLSGRIETNRLLQPPFREGHHFTRGLSVRRETAGSSTTWPRA